MKKKLLIAGIIVLAAVIGILIYRSHNQHEEGVLTLSGNVEITEVNTGFKFSGRISELLAEEGQTINKGDKIAVIDSAELESQVIQSRAYVSETLTRLAELRAGARLQEIEQAKANVGYAEAELVKSKKDYERSEALFQKEVIAAREMDAAKRTYDVALSRHKNAVETLSLVKEGPRKESIKAAEDRVQQAKAALGISEERLKDTVLFAPVSGVIMRKNMELGETVAPGAPVYTIGDLENPWIRVYVKEDKLGLVKLGQKAEITTDSHPGKKYEGVLTYISSEAEFTPKNVQTQEERVKLVFGIKVSAKNDNGELKPGMPADVKIRLK
jgi:HlyD family secretion protein